MDSPSSYLLYRERGPLSSLPPIGQCLPQPLHCAVCACTTQTTCELGKWSHVPLQSEIGWMFFFLSLILWCVEFWGWGLCQACLHICPVDSIVGPECWYLLTAWPKGRTTCVCAHIRYSSASCCVTLVVLGGCLCVVWKECVYLWLHEAECSTGCSCAQCFTQQHVASVIQRSEWRGNMAYIFSMFVLLSTWTSAVFVTVCKNLNNN